MPDWAKILEEIKGQPSPFDVVRRKYIGELSRHTERHVILYYSAWLQKADMVGSDFSGFDVNDSDKNGFMACINGLDRSKGLDLILHTPGGDIAATESLVDYLRQMFDSDIRAIVPQLAMSAGTMIALACKQIVMGKHSSLGPIDPQLGGMAAHGVTEEFERARQEILADDSAIAIWQPILAKYPPTLIGECEKAIDWSKEIVVRWLESGMFAGTGDATARAKAVVDELADHAVTKSHSRHYSYEAAEGLGLDIVRLEEEGNEEFQDKVLTVHHACIQTLASTGVYKLIENDIGVAQMLTLQPVG